MPHLYDITATDVLLQKYTYGFVFCVYKKI